MARKSVKLKIPDSIHGNRMNQFILKAFAKKFGHFFIVEDTLFNYHFDHPIVSRLTEIQNYYINDILFFACFLVIKIILLMSY